MKNQTMQTIQRVQLGRNAFDPVQYANGQAVGYRIPCALCGHLRDMPKFLNSYSLILTIPYRVILMLILS